MTRFIASALAITAMTASLAPAFAGEPTGMKVQFDDLDLESKAGQLTLDARIRNAARRVCDDSVMVGTRIRSNACEQGVRKQVLAQVEAWQNRIGKGG
ncbi:MAG: UrcA family protein [Novosphingobium sp.]